MSPRCTLRWISSIMVVLGMMFVSSCKDDEKPNSRFSFAESEIEVLEDDGTVELVINIDRAVSETVVLSYTLEGTATEFKAATGGDFEISPAGGNITIAPGATQAVVQIDLLPDQNFEVNFTEEIAYETIILTLTDVISGPGEIVAGEGTQVTVYVFEDDMVVFLNWDAGDGSTGDVDMDLMVWIDDPEDDPDRGLLLLNSEFVGGGVTPGTDPEAVLLLSQLLDTNYGFSYVYYGGTATTVNLEVQFINFGGTINGGEATATHTATYGLDNINAWDQEGAPLPIVVQTVTKAGRDYIDLSAITVPDMSSRSRIILGNFGDAPKVRSQSIQKFQISPEVLKRWTRK